MKPKHPRHPDLKTAAEAAAYMGISELCKLPAAYRPPTVAYSTKLYHRATLDRYIEAARREGETMGDTPQMKMRR